MLEFLLLLWGLTTAKLLVVVMLGLVAVTIVIVTVNVSKMNGNKRKNVVTMKQYNQCNCKEIKVRLSFPGLCGGI